MDQGHASRLHMLHVVQNPIVFAQLPKSVLDESDDVAVELSGALVVGRRGLEEAVTGVPS